MKESTPYLLLLPALIFTVFVVVYPLFQNLINSFLDISLVEGTKGWTGGTNYKNVLNDAVFWLSLLQRTFVKGLSAGALKQKNSKRQILNNK